MQLIVISGPSGSGKTTLSKRILKKIKNGIILNTDNYYRTGILSQILSRTLTSYFDRKISFNYGLLKANKQTCLNRVIKRDFLERGKSKDLARRDFIKAWELFHKNKKKCNSRNYFNTIVIRKKSDIDLILKKIINIVN